MNADEIRELKNELDAAAINIRELLQRQANTLILHRENAQAGALLVFERLVYQHGGNLLHWYAAAAPMAADEGTPQKRRGRPPKPASAKGSDHRHRFNAAGRCELCGAARQRAPKGGPGAAVDNSPEARTVPLPGVGAGSPRRPLGEHAGDRFDGGTMGSSGTGDRR